MMPIERWWGMTIQVILLGVNYTLHCAVTWPPRPGCAGD